jgi:hypothetical protein
VKLLIFTLMNRNQLLTGHAGVLAELNLLVRDGIEPINPDA